MALIQCRGVCFSHDSGPLLEGIDLAIEERDRLGIVGTNGCGKSTLLGLLAGDLTPSEGHVFRTPGLRVALVRQFGKPKAGETVRQLASCPGVPDHEVEESLSRLGFSDATWDHPAETLSGGWVNRLLLARAVASRPDVLLLDEPTNHLDRI
jgi:ATPase subunit of ABC transporter with duplicated ATPase domains